jgi:hypothetical protein
MRPFFIAVILGFPLIPFAQGALRAEPFVVVRGIRYEGAIVSESSPWRPFLFRDPAIRNEFSQPSKGWTPTEGDVASAEGALQTFVDRALQEPSSTTAVYRNVLVRGEITALANILPSLKRQYAGLITETDRVLFVHGFPADADQRWRTEPMFVMLGGGCRQFWMDFSVTNQHITRIRCGSSE